MNTDWIDRYVADVARRLPEEQRKEVSAELRSSIYDQLEDRSGPEAGEEDVLAVLRELGPPETVAASYLPATQYLIGPAWYPTFRRTLRIVFSVQAILFVLATAVMVFGYGNDLNPGEAIFYFLDVAVESVVWTFGIILLIFFCLERAGTHYEAKRPAWDPRQLPAVKPRDMVGRAESVISLVVWAVFLAFLHFFRNPPFLGDVVRANLPWLSLAILLGMAHHAVLLWQGRWHLYTRLGKLAIDLFGLFVVYRFGRDVMAALPTLTNAGLPIFLTDLIARLTWLVPLTVAVVILLEHSWVWFQRLRQRAVATS